MIEKFIIPQIDSENVIQFINEAYAKLKGLGKNGILRKNSTSSFIEKDSNFSLINQEKEEDSWYTLLDKSLDYMSMKNPINILRNQTNQQQIPKVILDEVCERVHKYTNAIPDHQMLKFM